MANYHKRNSIRAVQWDPENAQSFEDIKKLIAENPGIGWNAEKTAAVAPYRDRQGRLVLDDIHDLPEVVEKVFAGHPEFTHTFFHEGN